MIESLNLNSDRVVILWQLRSILPTTDLMFWTGAVLSLAIPFGLWYIFQKYYNWCKDPIKDQLRQEIEQKHATVITKKYDSMPWLDKQKVKNA